MPQMLGRPRAARAALSPAEWARLSGMSLVILALNLLGWGIFAFAIQPHHFRYAGLGIGLGVALTAWTLGARHAFDADHISAIDNTTRKLMTDGKRPLGTGFFFALGHSMIIVVVGIGLGFAAKAVFGAVVDPSSGYETIGGVVGTSMAAGFLYLIAALNLVVLAGIMKVFRGLRSGLFDEAELERQVQARGMMWRFFGRFMRSITKTWHMFFVGLIFGIGFDTATEVLLLAATAAAASQGLPWYAVLALPLLFSGGMTLFDTAGLMLHEHRLRVGVRLSGPQGLLQPRHHRPVRRRGVPHRHDRDHWPAVSRAACSRQLLGLHGQLRHQPCRVHHRRAVRCRLGGRHHLLETR